jgi:hypothetical protein
MRIRRIIALYISAWFSNANGRDLQYDIHGETKFINDIIAYLSAENTAR